MICEVAWIPPVLVVVPVVGPSWMNSVVAVTGMDPNSLNDPVAAGRLSSASE